MQPLPPGADEVGVQHPLAILRVLHQQPTTTLPTHHRALQEVVMHPLPLATAMGAQHSLDRLPRLLIHQRLVLARILHALELHHTLVVGVAQDLVQTRCCDGLGAAPWRGWDAQATVVEVLRQLPHRPIPRRILRKRQPHQRCTFFIHHHSPDLPPILVPGAHIHIPQRCLA